MKQEERQLLLKDLSARLPYNPMVHIHDPNTIDNISLNLVLKHRKENNV